jgi:hypothetical protein
LLSGGKGQVGGVIYGTLIVLAATVGAYAAERHDPAKLEELVVTAVAVLWLAYVYVHTLADCLETRRPLSRGAVLRVARGELGIPLAAVLPGTALLLGVIGVVDESATIWLAIALGVLILVVEGVRYARMQHLDRVGTFAIVIVNLAFALFVVALKIIFAH